MDKIYPSVLYNFCDDLWLITSYFNPSRYKTKLENYKIFERIIRKSKLNLLTVECAFTGGDFELTSFQDVFRVKTNSVMWQKENLLNIAIKNLPLSAKKVVWIDCDVLFSNPNWAVETAKLLDDYPIVQPFQTVIRLSKHQEYYNGKGHKSESFAYVRQKNPQLHLLSNFNLHGHTGMAWAAHLDLLRKHKLYPGCISGSGDHIMAHAMCGRFTDPCVQRILGEPKINNKVFQYFLNWAYPFFQDVRSNIGFVPGEVLHLWHGEIENRQYLERHKELRKIGFNPYEDLILSENGTWDWNNKIELQNWAKRYFELRLEDG